MSRSVIYILAAFVLAGVFDCIQPAGVNGFVNTPLTVKSFKRHYLNPPSKKYYGPKSISTVRRFTDPTDTIRSVSEFGKDDDKNNPTDPSTWYDDLSPEVFLQFFAKEGSISELLLLNEIKTIQDLKSKRGFALMLLIKRDEVGQEIFDALTAALSRSRKTPENLLGGQVVYDSSCISENVFKVYSEGAVSVRPIRMAPPNDKCRNTEFSLVLGPSGTGKTLFALRRLPQLACSDNLKECFRVHLKASRAYALVTGKRVTFTEAVTEMVQSAIQRKLKAKEDVSDEDLPIDLYLHVTIDEAGLDSTQDCFSTAIAILGIVGALKAMNYRFTKGVHVTVAGTGLEEITSSIVSEVEVTKFRMKPWSEIQFDALVDASSHPQRSLIKEVVRKFAILRDLITNGRCSYYIVTSTTTERFLQDFLLRGFVKVLVSAVASEFIATNGMSALKTAEQKWEVCQSVWRQLDLATNQRNVAFLPQFDNIKNVAVRNAAKMLMEVHVELKAGKPEFVDASCSYSLSVSPALAIVMARLVNADAELSWDWESFETVVMLSELKYVIANSKDNLRKPERPVIELLSPLPASKKETLCAIPIVNRNIVVLNGRKASYADVIAPYRLVQAKIAAEGATSKVTIDLMEELDKMGLLAAGKGQCSSQQAITSSFYHMWETLEAVLRPFARRVPFGNRTTDEMRRESYPYSTLTTPESVEQEPVVMYYDASTMKFLFSKEDADHSDDERKALVDVVESMNESGPLLEFNELRPVYTVFATNGDAFNVPKNGVTMAKVFSVERNDVNWQGVVTTSIPELDVVAKELRSNVQIRFQFY